MDTTHADPSLYNHDLAPVEQKDRSWGIYNDASLWVAMSVCIPTYMLASGLIKHHGASNSAHASAPAPPNPEA